MTSAISFTKLIRTERKQLMWLTVLQAVAFALSVPLFVLMNMTVTLEDQKTAWVDADARVMLEVLGASMGLDRYPDVLLALIFGIIAALGAFCYVHSREKLDFYHSLPLRRDRFFLCGYLCAGTCMRPSDWRAVSCILSDGSHRDGGYICPESAVFLLQLCGNAGSGHADGQAVDDALCTCGLFRIPSAAADSSDRLFCRLLSDDLREYGVAVDEQSISDIESYIAVGLLYDMGEWQGDRCGRRDRAMAEYHGDLSAGGDYGAALLSGACALPVSKK